MKNNKFYIVIALLSIVVLVNINWNEVFGAFDDNNSEISNFETDLPTIDSTASPAIDSIASSQEQTVPEEVVPEEVPVSSYNPEDYSKFHDNALTLLINGDLDNALIEINKALEINPKKADSYYVRGNIFQQKGYLNDALNDFLQAISLNPKHSEATMKCAIIYGKLNDRGMSCLYIRRACDLGVSDACSGYNRFCN